MAVLRNAAITCGILPVLACEASYGEGVSDPMDLVFYRPMSTLEFEQIFCGGGFGCEACNAILRMMADLTCFRLLSISLIAINLCSPGQNLSTKCLLNRARCDTNIVLYQEVRLLRCVGSQTFAPRRYVERGTKS